MKHDGKVGLIILIAVLVVVGLLVIFGGVFVSGYNKAIRLRERATQAWQDVEADLQRRMDLVPNLVETVKGYAEHEEQIFTSIAKSREKYFQAKNAGNKEEQIESANEVAGLLSRLLMLRENYPELKANENFRDLQAQLEGTENRINVSRKRYNEAAQQLNYYCKSFFGRFFCNLAGVEPARYFEATEQARTEVPKVEF